MCDEHRAAGAKFNFLYPLELSVKDKIAAVCGTYGAAGVEYSEAAEEQIAAYEAAGFGRLPVCMAKTQFSLSTNPALKGTPEGFTIKVGALTRPSPRQH